NQLRKSSLRNIRQNSFAQQFTVLVPHSKQKRFVAPGPLIQLDTCNFWFSSERSAQVWVKGFSSRTRDLVMKHRRVHSGLFVKPNDQTVLFICVLEPSKFMPSSVRDFSHAQRSNYYVRKVPFLSRFSQFPLISIFRAFNLFDRRFVL